MSNNNRPRPEGISDHETIEMEPPGVSQDQSEDLEREGDDLWSALQQQFSSAECGLIFAIFVVIILLINNVVILILALNGTIC